MELVSLASGSKGNCILVRSATTSLLIDAGIGINRIKSSLAQLGMSLNDINGVLVTHEHSDHIRALESLVNRAGVCLYGNENTLLAAQKVLRTAFDVKKTRIFTTGEDFVVGDIDVRPFHTSHDAAESVGFVMRNGRAQIGIATDTGYVTREIGNTVSDSDILLLESNHDEQMLLDGPYPSYLKNRILSRKGHLSNETCADVAVKLLDRNVRCIILGHLSQTNNTPQLAYDTVCRELTSAGANIGSDIMLSVATQEAISKIYSTEDVK